VRSKIGVTSVDVARRMYSDAVGMTMRVSSRSLVLEMHFGTIVCAAQCLMIL